MNETSKKVIMGSPSRFFSCHVYIRDLEKDLDTPLNLKVETITHLELLFWLIYFPNITGAKINTLVSHPLIFIY